MASKKSAAAVVEAPEEQVLSEESAAAVNAVINSLGINQDYAQEEESGLLIPWVQASHNEPSITDDVRLVLTEASLERLEPEALEMLSLVDVPTVFNGEIGSAKEVANGRWVILNQASSEYAQAREGDGEIVKLPQGTKYGTEWKSVSKVFLALVVTDSEGNQKLLPNEDGDPAVFGLKLAGIRSTWTRLKSDQVNVTIPAMNKIAKRKYGVKGWVTHCVSVPLAVKTVKVTSKNDAKKSSVVPFVCFPEGIEDDVVALPSNLQKEISFLLKDEAYQEMVANPFGPISSFEDVTNEFEVAAPTAGTATQSIDDADVDY